MNITLIISGAVVISILLHAAGTIWWASKVTSELGHISAELSRVTREFDKRDVEMRAMWKRVDELRMEVSQLRGAYNKEALS